MTKEELITEFISQGIKANSRVEITTEKGGVIGKLTDAKVHSDNDKNNFERIKAI